jgi:hypothetical protein
VDKEIPEAWLKQIDSLFSVTYYCGTLNIDNETISLTGHAPGLEQEVHNLFTIPITSISRVVIYPGAVTIKATGKKYQIYLYNPIKGIGATSKGYSPQMRALKRQPGIGDIGDPSILNTIPKSNELAELFQNAGVKVVNKTNNWLQRWFIGSTEQNLRVMKFFDKPSVNQIWRLALWVLSALIILLAAISLFAAHK